eukprot:CAMPEP_0113626084 /NCGR_PEP_ID=MMETSP0017_2-20120614/13483_1 /TAXON_ID=2856 /ORGANISM="Cylindrotheca closterium" /LENGTH=30 /DNA_ID=CAMNT_0000536239 /DNA_START=349 /DNA_END=438 /DNA_ORIENTATION=+ /assembly_acc=CAM_ASM_000147
MYENYYEKKKDSGANDSELAALDKKIAEQE